jgi:hypothetical protein
MPMAWWLMNAQEGMLLSLSNRSREQLRGMQWKHLIRAYPSHHTLRIAGVNCLVMWWHLVLSWNDKQHSNHWHLYYPRRDSSRLWKVLRYPQHIKLISSVIGDYRQSDYGAHTNTWVQIISYLIWSYRQHVLTFELGSSN